MEVVVAAAGVKVDVVVGVAQKLGDNGVSGCVCVTVVWLLLLVVVSGLVSVAVAVAVG